MSFWTNFVDALLDALNLLYGYEAYRQMVIEKSLNSEAGRAEQP